MIISLLLASVKGFVFSVLHTSALTVLSQDKGIGVSCAESISIEHQYYFHPPF